MDGPDFIGIGAMRAGTTWLYEQMLGHPQLRFPAGKETNHWTAWHGRGVPAAAYLRRFGGREPGRLAGEISPEYAALEPGVIAEVRRHVPEARLFVILRSPVERDWSEALMTLRDACEMEPGEASEAWFLDVLGSRTLRRRGDYLACLRAWRAQYPPEQLHVMLMDDLVERPRDLLRGLYRHIGASEAPADAAPEADLRRRVNSDGRPGRARAGEAWPLPSRLRAHLVERHRGHVEELSAELGRDLSRWL